MNDGSFTTAFTVEQSADEVFSAINNVRGWWSGNIEGSTDHLNAEFIYRYEAFHYSKQVVTEFVPGKRVVWRVLDSSINFVNDKDEWTGTEVIFDISRRDGKTELRFTHKGLVPTIECYGGCSNAWGSLVNGSLRDLITTGKAPSIRL